MRLNKPSADETEYPQCNLLDLEDVIQKLDEFKSTTDAAATAKDKVASRKLYVRAALVIHPDKNPESLKQQTQIWFNTLCEAWERCEARFKSTATSASPVSPTSGSPVSPTSETPTYSAPPARVPLGWPERLKNSAGRPFATQKIQSWPN
jgi:hypothetical protein